MSLKLPGSVLLISCYELGHQPLAAAMPLAFLERAGFAPDAMDLAVEGWNQAKVRRARFVGIAVPMHTALRLGVRAAERVRETNPGATICFYGLYAALNAEYLLTHGARFCVGGEFEAPLTALVAAIDAGEDTTIPGVVGRGEDEGGPPVARLAADRPPFLERLSFPVPSRAALPPLHQYAQLEEDGNRRVAGYVEASRGCAHRCTHCPIPPVYHGRFFVVPQEIVLEDIRRQVRAGATHITFGDPDFLNGPGHALRIARALHAEFPELTFDFTAKIEHILERRALFPEFAASGCLFVVSAVESLSDTVLAVLEKEHTRAEVTLALAIIHDAGIALRPTWVPFTPWTTRDDYREMLEFIEASGLIDHVDPVQYTIRLLVPPGSFLANHPAMQPHRGPLDPAAFSYRWTHPDPGMDDLHRSVTRLVEVDTRAGEDPELTFHRVRALATGQQPGDAAPVPRGRRISRAPRLTEPWFC
jgi:radical SAM superfamily enzyme YgiQ (UPF0313 family)